VIYASPACIKFEILFSIENERLPASIVTKAIDDVKEKAKTNQRRRLAKK
jgi:hypothetical protein